MSYPLKITKGAAVLLLPLLLLHCKAKAATGDSLSFRLSGYVKGLEWATFTDEFSRKNFTFLFHNRLNGRWQYGDHLEGRIELRNRFLAGDDVRSNPLYGKQLSASDDWIRLNTYAPDSATYIFHTNVERLWAQYKTDKWTIRAGRQRINWGMTTVWNPNDIFNYYNFLDFDYEERAGADALKATYFSDQESSWEAAIALTGNRPVFALKYQTNFKKYDLQILGGSYKNAFSAGLGWAGSLGNVGFKGELQYFGKDSSQKEDFFSSTQFDYLFSHGWYTAFSILYNKNGRNSVWKPGDNFLFNLSPRNLMPARWNLLISGNKEFTPRLNGGLNVIYSPNVNLFIFFPSLQYNLSTNLDFNLFWQTFYFEYDQFSTRNHTAFIRFKWSF